MKRHGKSENVVTDRFASYRAALRELGALETQQTGRLLNNHFNQERSLTSRENLQVETQRRSCRVARTWRWIKDSVTVLIETGSNSSDSTVTHTHLTFLPFPDPDS